jgi:GNAT superfamily N-acetyltransferase
LTPQVSTHLRRCAPGDENALALVGAATNLETYAGFLTGADIIAYSAVNHTPAFYGAWLADPARAAWLVEADIGLAPVGLLTAGPATSPHSTASDFEVHRLYVFSRFHGGGIGARLIDAAADAARAGGKARLILGVNKKNRAVGFYQKMGLAIVGERTFTVGATTHEDYVMAKSL